MRRFVLPVILQLACVILPNVSALGQAVPDKEIASRIQAYLQPFGETGNVIGTVLVARGGRILFRQSYGMANYELGVPNSSETRYHIASVSKPFTAAAILQLQEQGRLSVSDHVSKYVPGFPNGERITLDHLLTHSSGIPDINGIEGIDTFERSPHTLEQLVAKYAGLPLGFAPGSKQSYSNSNYNLLALILEKVSG
ncbi:MAG TPA: serine hydrolase domain-containing protein, partial [Terriglobales bacterium]|nr:serine hydrolase domain-containing protein [Terriglobales bacterium]